MDMVALFAAMFAMLFHALLKRFWLAVLLSASLGFGLTLVLVAAMGHYDPVVVWADSRTMWSMLGGFTLAYLVAVIVGLIFRWLETRNNHSKANGL